MATSYSHFQSEDFEVVLLHHYIEFMIKHRSSMILIIRKVTSQKKNVKALNFPLWTGAQIFPFAMFQD
jgi:hypothetical protein